MAIDPSCWVQLQGPTTPAARGPQVTVGTGDPTTGVPTIPAPPFPHVEGDIFVSSDLKLSWVWDADTAKWQQLGGAPAPSGDNVYWGWGADPTVDIYAAGQAKAGGTPAYREARVQNVSGAMEVQVYNDPSAIAGPAGVGSGYDPSKWETVTDIKAGDEYVDMNPPQAIYQLSP
jgi:hypothetical protein